MCHTHAGKCYNTHSFVLCMCMSHACLCIQLHAVCLVSKHYLIVNAAYTYLENRGIWVRIDCDNALGVLHASNMLDST